MPSITVPVREVVAATPRTRILSLDVRQAPFDFAAGQAVMVGLHRSPLRKPYSIASAPSEVRRHAVLELLLLVDDSGGPDPHLERATAGTTLDVEGPFGSFGLDHAVPDAALLVAGGTGIAPLRSMIVEWLGAARAPRLALVYSARSSDELAYRDELEAVQTSGRLSLDLTVTREGEPWTGRRGRIDEALLAKALPSPRAHVVVCGPPRLVDDVRSALPRLGVAEERFHIQRI